MYSTRPRCPVGLRVLAVAVQRLLVSSCCIQYRTPYRRLRIQYRTISHVVMLLLGPFLDEL